MQIPKEESLANNKQTGAKRINYALDPQTSVYCSTFQMRVENKNEIILGCDRLKETQWLFRQYGQKTPGWLRSKFILNQYRRKCLNDNLREAQLDAAFCGKYSHTREWHDLLHSVWHDINGRQLCK